MSLSLFLFRTPCHSLTSWQLPLHVTLLFSRPKVPDISDEKKDIKNKLKLLCNVRELT